MKDYRFRAWWNQKMLPVFAVNPMNHTVYLSHQQLFNTPGDDVLVKWNDDIEDEGCELMQFTGFRNMAGVDIYEGDIVQYGALVALVEFEGGAFRAPYRTKVNQVYNLLNVQCEVIGNIYENPELLEREKSKRAEELHEAIESIERGAPKEKNGKKDTNR